MSDYAMVNNQTNRVDNVIIWDGVMPYAPPEGYTLVEIPAPSETEPTPGEGWFYIDGAFVEVTPTEVTPTEVTPTEITEQL